MQVVRSRLQQRMDDGRTLVYRSATEVGAQHWVRGAATAGPGPAGGGAASLLPLLPPLPTALGNLRDSK